MTGYHTGHAYIRGNFPVNGHDLPLRPQDFTVAQMLQSAGYYTALVGKWGMGWNDTTGQPNLKGFDYFYGQLDQNNCHNMYPPFIWEQRAQIFFPNNANASREVCMAPGNNCTYTHDLWTNRTLALLEERAALGPTQPPFFLFLAYTDPHAGGWQGIFESGNPVPSDGSFTNASWPDVERDHASVIANYLDRDVGRIVGALDTLGFGDDTLVIFASDNGAQNEGGHNYLFFNSSGPLRGYKRSLYEGGIRTPTIARWTGTIAPQQVSDVPWAFWDFMPTAADLAGLPRSAYPADIDGLSIAPLLLGNASAQPVHDYFYWEFCTYHETSPGQGANGWGSAIRKGDWKAVSFFLNSPFELYNITADLGETNNLAAAYPAVVAELSALAKQAHVDSPIFPQVNCIPS